MNPIYIYNYLTVFLKTIAPTFRNVNITKVYSLVAIPLQELSNNMFNSFMPQQTELSNYNSSKTLFEYILNKVFNIASYLDPIFIINTPQNDLVFYGYNKTETQDRVLTTLYFTQNFRRIPFGSIPTYNPLQAYNINDLVIFNNEIYEAYNQSFSPPNNDINNPYWWKKMTYGHNENALVLQNDFLVYIPIALNLTDFNTRITSFIDQYKMVHVKYTIVYY